MMIDNIGRDDVANSCMVVSNGELVQSNEYIAFISKESGDLAMYFQTDALTIGMGVKMLTNAYNRMIEMCSKEDREEIEYLLNNSSIQEDRSDEVN